MYYYTLNNDIYFGPNCSKLFGKTRTHSSIFVMICDYNDPLSPTTGRTQRLDSTDMDKDVNKILPN